MYNFLTKNGQTLAFGLGVLLVIIFFVSVNSGLGDFLAAGDGAEKYETGIFNFGLNAAMALTILSAAAMLLFGLYHIATNLKGSWKAIAGVVALALVFIITYNMASGEPETEAIKDAITKYSTDGRTITPGNLKFIGGSIMTMLILAGIAAVAFVVSEVINFFK